MLSPSSSSLRRTGAVILKPEHNEAGLDPELSAGQNVLDFLLDAEGNVIVGIANISIAGLVLLKQHKVSLLITSVIATNVELLISGYDRCVVGSPALQLMLGHVFLKKIE
jgi:hypothetical protein